MLKATVYGNSDTGIVRNNNEDAYIAQLIWDDKHWLLVVIDGLGGYEGGEVAASIAKRTILNSVEKMHGKNCLDVIMQSVADANNAIFDQRNSTEGLDNMGCVITAVMLDLAKKQLSVAHVGDTRLYQYNNNGLVKLTHDHSFVGGLEDEGHITEEDAMNHPRRNLIDRIVGYGLKDIESPRFIEASVFPVSKGDQYLLCSDGLSDMITSTEICSVLQKGINVRKKVKRLIDFANKKGGKDNITVIVADIGLETERINFGRKVMSQDRNTVKSKRKKQHKQKNDIIQNTILKGKYEDGFYKKGFIILIIVVVVLSFLLLIHPNI